MRGDVHSEGEGEENMSNTRRTQIAALRQSCRVAEAIGGGVNSARSGKPDCDLVDLLRLGLANARGGGFRHADGTLAAWTQQKYADFFSPFFVENLGYAAFQRLIVEDQHEQAEEMTLITTGSY